MIKLFKMNENDWVAAENLEDAKRALAETMNDGKQGEAFEEEFIDCSHEIDDADLDVLKLTDDDEMQEAMETLPTDKGEEWKERYQKYLESAPTFRQALQKMIDEGTEFPTHFASADY